MSKIRSILSKPYSVLLVLSTAFLPLFLPPAAGLAVSGQGIVIATNRERATMDLPPLAWNPLLAQSAWQKAQDMCSRGYWAHEAPDGTTAWTLISRAGYRIASAGENLARGFDSDLAVVAGWMASPGHRSNMLSAGYQDIGVGSATCLFEGAETTIVAAHYGSQTTSQRTASAHQQAASTSSRQKTTQKSTRQPATAPVKTTAEATLTQPPAAAKPKPNLGLHLWKLALQNNWTIGWPVATSQHPSP